jgi:hypothetical protein
MSTREAEIGHILADLEALDVLISGPVPPDDDEMADIRRELAELKARIRRLMQ